MSDQPKGWPRSISPKMERRAKVMIAEAEANRRKENVKTMTDANVYHDIVEELRRARAKHPIAFHSSHEGWAILKEEVDELWQEVKKQTEERSYSKLRKEAIQVAAMAVRFIEDVCNPRMPQFRDPSPDPTLLQKPKEGSSEPDGKKEEGSSSPSNPAATK